MTSVTSAAGPLRRDLRALDTAAPQPPARALRTGIRRRILGVVVALALVAAAVLILMNEAAMRLLEAQLSAVVVGAFAQEAVFAWSAYQPSVAFTLDGGDGWHVARITASCAIAFYLAPILAVGAMFALNRRMSLGRIALATAAGLVGMVLLNQLRILAICFAWGTWGLTGFHWMHGPLGTGLMLVGIAATLLVFFLIVIRGGRRKTRMSRNPRD